MDCGLAGVEREPAPAALTALAAAADPAIVGQAVTAAAAACAALLLW